MKSIKKLVLSAVLGIFAVSAVGCSMIEKTPEAIKAQVVAEVKGEKITRAQLDEKVSKTVKQLEQMYGEDAIKQKFGENYTESKELKQSILDQMVDQIIYKKEAEAKKVMPKDLDKAADAEYKKQYATWKESYEKQGKTEKDLKADLKKAGTTEKDYKDSYKEAKIIEAVKANLTKDVKVEDKEIKEYYDKNQESYTEQPNKIQLRHILVKTEDEAKKVKERLKNGEKFEALAKELSQDTGTKEDGGVLPEVETSKMNYVDAFKEAALKLKKDEISEPVKTSYGYHIIQCLKRENHPVKAFDTVKEEIKKLLLEQKQTTTFEEKFSKLKKDAKVKINEKYLTNK